MALTPHTVLYHVPKVEYKKLCVEGENDARADRHDATALQGAEDDGRCCSNAR